MAKKKYYAVKKGHHPGIYRTWDECKKETDGFGGAVFKGFATLEDAEYYLNPEKKRPVSNADAEIYVDGSFQMGICGWGFVAFKDGEIIFSTKGVLINPEAVKIHNVAGEIQATVEATLWAEANGYEKIIIYHDYNGVGMWGRGEWKANTPLTQKYSEFMSTRRDFIEFKKIPSHSGIAGNELADKLANQAIQENI